MEQLCDVSRLQVRNLVRIAAAPWGFPLGETALLEMHARWVIAMPYLLKNHLEGVSARADLETPAASRRVGVPPGRLPALPQMRAGAQDTLPHPLKAVQASPSPARISRVVFF